MDAVLADRLATSIDPKALAKLKDRDRDPAVGKAIAGQFGAFLMQGLLQDSSGDALPMAGGTGGPAVSAMFASTMGRYAAEHDQLGLADTIYKSMVAQQNGGHTPAAGSTTSSGAAPAAATATNNVVAIPRMGLPLTPYWQDNGRRPIGAPIGHFTPAPGASASPRATAIVPAAKAASTAGSATPSRIAPPPPATPTVAAKSPARPWTVMTLPRVGQILLPPAEPSTPSEAAPATPAAAAGRGVSATPPMPLPRSQPSNSGTDGSAAPVPRSAATPPAASGATDPEQFAETMAPALREAAARLGVSPRILLAQAALETGWGHSVVGNNVFGIKAGTAWSGTTVTAQTHEMEDGRSVAHRGTFRSYANVTQAVDDYVSLVSNSSRYRAALGAGDNVAAYAQALAAGGYATDRDYATKLTEIAESPRLEYAAATLEETSPGQLVSAHG